jgi:3-phenylpropionate/trans-cinnamate dioxygenase ferredoxin component
LKKEEIFLCKENEIPEGKSKRFESFGQNILVFKLKGSIYAIESICPHVFADLSAGKLNARAGTIKCANHGAVFDLRTGEALCGPYGVDGEILPSLTFFKVIQREGNVIMIKDDFSP